jgi:hypothetical protein
MVPSVFGSRVCARIWSLSMLNFYDEIGRPDVN